MSCRPWSLTYKWPQLTKATIQHSITLRLVKKEINFLWTPSAIGTALILRSEDSRCFSNKSWLSNLSYVSIIQSPCAPVVEVGTNSSCGQNPCKIKPICIIENDKEIIWRRKLNKKPIWPFAVFWKHFLLHFYEFMFDPLNTVYLESNTICKILKVQQFNWPDKTVFI